MGSIMRSPLRQLFAIASVACALLLPQAAHADRLKDLTSIAGVRQNQLSGYCIVVCLDGSGDQTTQTTFSVQ
jgi:flagellar P-ring protein precursor FlgI